LSKDNRKSRSGTS